MSPTPRTRPAAEEPRELEGDLPQNHARAARGPGGVTCPQDGTPMIAHPVPDERTLLTDMVKRGSQTAYAANVAASMREKEDAAGVVYTCPACGYVMRVKDAA
jgi:hypothetical protein